MTMPIEIEALFRCERCGAPMIRKRKNQRFCPACRKDAQREQQRAYRARVRAERGAKPRPIVPGGRKTTDTPESQAKSYKPETAENLVGSVFDLRGKSLSRVSHEAHALSLSYGEYVTLVQAGTIRKFLRSERGIADPDGTLRRLVGGKR